VFALARTFCLSFSDCLGLAALRESLNDIRVLQVFVNHVKARVSDCSTLLISCNAGNGRTPSCLPPTGVDVSRLPFGRGGLSGWVLDVNMATAVLHRLWCIDDALVVRLFGLWI
jgi:hypothetical protein